MKKKKLFIALGIVLIVAALAVSALIIPPREKHESIQELMKDAVLHEDNKVSLFGITEVNPAVISGMTVTGIILLFAAVLRIFVIPKFKMIPGKFQILIEEWVKFFDSLARENSPDRPNFIGAYIFSAGSYIFIGTIFELFGAQAVTTEGYPIALPAPLADINAAIAIGCMSYLVILGGGLIFNGFKGAGGALKDFSLPISMSFRLFGALLSGLLVTELVYYTISLSFFLPVIVGVLFTLIHALVQAYVLSMLVSMFYGEATEHHEKKKKEKKIKVIKKAKA